MSNLLELSFCLLWTEEFLEIGDFDVCFGLKVAQTESIEIDLLHQLGFRIAQTKAFVGSPLM